MNIEMNTSLRSDGIAVISLGGRLTAVSTPDLKQEINRLVDEGYVRIVFDLEQVTFLDSSGLAAFVSALKLTRSSDGSVKLCGMSEQVASIFDLTRLDRVFDIYQDTSVAMSTFE